MRSCFGFMVLMVLGGAADPVHAAGRAVRDHPLPADPFCAVHVGACTPPPYVMVISAFPAELQPLLAATGVTEAILAGERKYHVGVLAGVRVLLVRGGIALTNAATTTRAALDRFPVSAIVFSGVAGSGLYIGDVAVPADWTDGTATFPADASLLAVARTLASPPVSLERCTPAPPATPSKPAGPIVCLDHTPQIVVGGHGESSDPLGFTGRPFPCVPGRGFIFGCDEALSGLAVLAATPPAADASDEETAAVARVARDAGVPYIGFRGVSDGMGDPLNLGGFPFSFFYYYQLAADNAAAVTMAFLDGWRIRAPGVAAVTREEPMTATSPPRIGAACDWPAAANPVCRGEQASRAVTRSVDRACTLLSNAARNPGSAAARRALRRARETWGRTARLVKVSPSPRLTADCRTALRGALETRAGRRSP